jgi:hypothetical protein
MPAPAVDRELLDLAVTVAQRAGGAAAERFFAADFATRTKDEHGPAIGVINNPMARRIVFAGRGLGSCRRSPGPLPIPGSRTAFRARDLLAVKGFDTKHTVLTCYSGGGFSRELQAAQSYDIRLVGLDHLYAG